jgi:platelet-activating factor acetylhydrolase IB subunit alpha
VLTISFDGSMIASGSDDQTVRLWDVGSSECTQILSGLMHVVECIAFSNANTDTVIHENFALADPNSWKRSAPLAAAAAGGNKDATTSSIASSHSDVVTTPVHNKTSTTGHPPITRTNSVKPPNSAAKVNPTLPPAASVVPVTKPQFLVLGTRDKEIRVYDILSTSLLFTLRGHDDWVRSVSFHKSGKYIMSCGDDRSIQIWDIATQRCKKKLQNAHEHFVTCFVMHGKKPIAASASVDKTIKVWQCK